jgi:chromosome segregation ATPase
MPVNIPQCLAALVFFSLLPFSGLRADDAANASFQTRMRETLRATMQQLNDAQNQLATAQAAQAQSEKDNMDLKAKMDTLTAQMAALTKQSEDDKAASDKAISDLKSQNADFTKQIALLKDALAAWEKDDKQYVQLAKDKEAARAQLAGQVILLQRLVDDRESKNRALYNLGNEILERYEKFSLGDALAAKEPFTGISRVKLEELVQDYKGKILDQRITPGQPLPPEPAGAAGKPKLEPATDNSGKKTAAQQQTARTSTE